jgi:hypothetical protein
MEFARGERHSRWRRQTKETTISDPCQVTTEKTARVAKASAD